MIQDDPNNQPKPNSNQTVVIKNLTEVHDQGDRGICYATSIATLVRNSDFVKGVQPSPHDQIVQKILQHQMDKGRNPDDGGNVVQITNELFNKYNLHAEQVNVEDAEKALSNNQSTALTLYLNDDQWEDFRATLQKDPQAVYEIPPQVTGKQVIGHACIIVGQTDEHFLVKNSWGGQWGDKGFFRISKKSFSNNSLCGIILLKTILDGPLTTLRQTYLQNRNNAPQYKGGIKEGFRKEDCTYKHAIDKKNDHLISQQKDLVGLKHKNINEVKDVFYDKVKGQHIIAQKHYDRTLEQRVKEERISGIESAYIARDCLSGLEFLEKHQRNHGDIKSNNVVYDKDSKVSKLSDFDLSKKYDKQNQKAQFQQAKKKDSKMLGQMLKNVQNTQNDKNTDQDKEYFQGVQKKLQQNTGDHTQARKQIQNQIILKEHNQQSKFQLGVVRFSGVANTVNAVAKDIYHNGLSNNTLKTGVKQLIKTGIGIEVKALEQSYKKNKILENVDNHNYKLGVREEMAFMAVTEVGKELVNLATGKEEIAPQKLFQSAKKVGVNLAEYGTCRAVTKYAEKKILGKATEKIANFGASTISSTAGKATSGIATVAKETLKQTKTQVFKAGIFSSAKSNAISSAVGFITGTVFDVARGKSLKQSAIDNGKSTVWSFVGSVIGAGIGSIIPGVGTAIGEVVGGVLGGLLSSWF